MTGSDIWMTAALTSHSSNMTHALGLSRQQSTGANISDG